MESGRPATRLEALAMKYGTDKLQHGYIPFYEKHLPREPKRILEIGVKEGKSIAMWTEYFPNAEIWGLDLFEENHHHECMELMIANGMNDNTRLHLIKGNQCDWQVSEQLRKQDFDIIIDDGSHNARDQMITFFGLFNGKHYFIEDLHCNNEDFYSQELPIGFRAATLFNDIRIGNYDTGYENDIIFGHSVIINDQYKIVCIKSSDIIR